MQPPAAVLLDIDNTVYAYAPCLAAGLSAAHAAARQLDPRWQDLDDFVRDYDQARRAVKAHTAGQAAEHCRLLYFKRMFEAAHGASRLAATCLLHDAYWRGYFAAMQLDPGCAGLLAAWRAAGVRLAWVSDFTTERQFLKLQALGLEESADFLLTSEEAGAEKPNPRIVELALQRLDVAPAQAWLVGDSIARDVAAAQACGLMPVWFNRQPDAPSGSPPPDLVVEDWHALRALWKQALGGGAGRVGGSASG